MLHRSPRRRARGVSLIEALVALAVMAFGMLGVVGMQATLRNSADQSKQRSEALRLAQQEMERLRVFGVLTGSPVGEHDYAKIVAAPAASVQSTATPGFAANTVYWRDVEVVDHPASSSASSPRMKTVSVNVTWQDREFDAAQGTRDVRSIRLNSVIAQVSPELGVGLGLPTNRSAPQRPGGRHVSIPPGAVVNPANPNTSIFAPPGAGGVTWVFVNDTGVIAQRCTSSGTCTTLGALLLSGYINFATGAAPTAAEAETPVDAALSNIGISAYQTWPNPAPQTIGTATGECFTGLVPASTTVIAYYCAMPILPAVPVPGNDLTWTATVDVTHPDLATTLTDDNATKFKVCRYTPDPNTDTPAGGNEAHPLTYNRVPSGLTNQNYLIISAGSGTGAGGSGFSCPLDTITNLVNANTRQHYPR